MGLGFGSTATVVADVGAEVVKVGVPHGVDGGQATDRVADEEALQEIAALGVKLGHDLRPRHRRVVHGERLVVWKLGHSRPVFFRWRPEQL